MKSIIPILCTILVLALCYTTVKTNKQTIIMSVGTIERNNAVMRKSADSIEARGGDATKIRAEILYYETEVKRYREHLKRIEWI